MCAAAAEVQTNLPLPRRLVALGWAIYNRYLEIMLKENLRQING
jgi:hypothetical protein